MAYIIPVTQFPPTAAHLPQVECTRRRDACTTSQVGTCGATVSAAFACNTSRGWGTWGEARERVVQPSRLHSPATQVGAGEHGVRLGNVWCSRLGCRLSAGGTPAPRARWELVVQPSRLHSSEPPKTAIR